jgi:MOSC domain-containing protein YiiM
MPRPNPNQVQVGKVTYVGTSDVSLTNHIKTVPKASIEINYNGVLGDYHSGLHIRDPFNKNSPFKHSKKHVQLHQQGYRMFRFGQVCLLDSNTTQILKSAGIDSYPGALGEQIYVDGVDLNACHAGTIISIGSTVQLEVVSSRTYCKKFSYDLTNPFNGKSGFVDVKFREQVRRAIFDAECNSNYPPHIGIYARVIAIGIIGLNDPVQVDASASAHYNKSNVPILPTSVKDITLARLRWLTIEQFKEMVKIVPADCVETFYK